MNLTFEKCIYLKILQISPNCPILSHEYIMNSEITLFFQKEDEIKNTKK